MERGRSSERRVRRPVSALICGEVLTQNGRRESPRRRRQVADVLTSARSAGSRRGRDVGGRGDAVSQMAVAAA